MATYQFEEFGKFKYTKDSLGKYHSFDDKPAIEYLDESKLKIWYKHGVIHRDFEKQTLPNGDEMIIKKPAIQYISKNLTYNHVFEYEHIKEYFINGKLFEDKQPTTCYPDETY